MNSEVLKTLQRSPVFSGLTDAELTALLESASAHTLQGGRLLFREGGAGNSLIVLSRGWVVLSRTTPSGRQIQIGKAGPGEVLGEMALLDPAPRSATATVLAPILAHEISAVQFQALLNQRHSGAIKLLGQLNKLLCSRLRSVADRIETELIAMRLDAPTYPIPRMTPRVESSVNPERATTLVEPNPDLVDTARRPALAASQRLEEKKESAEEFTDVPIEPPSFELARQGGIWKLLWGIKEP